jgi:hypothetical protein
MVSYKQYQYIDNQSAGAEETPETSRSLLNTPQILGNSSVGIALGYRLDDRGSRVRFQGGGAGNFFLHHSVQNGSGAHRASYPMGTRGSFPGSIAAGG